MLKYLVIPTLLSSMIIGEEIKSWTFLDNLEDDEISAFYADIFNESPDILFLHSETQKRIEEPLCKDYPNFLNLGDISILSKHPLSSLSVLSNNGRQDLIIKFEMGRNAYFVPVIHDQNDEESWLYIYENIFADAMKTSTNPFILNQLVGLGKFQPIILSQHLNLEGDLLASYSVDIDAKVNNEGDVQVRGGVTWEDTTEKGTHVEIEGSGSVNRDPSGKVTGEASIGVTIKT